MKFAILGVLIVLLIGFFVVVWKAARDWRWYHIVGVCVTMLLAVAFLFPTAGVLKSRAAWHQTKEQLEIQAAEAMAEQRVLKYGDPADPAAGEGLLAVTRRLDKLGIEAGRRWRGLQLQNVANNTVTLTMPAAAQQGAPGVPGVPTAPPTQPPAGQPPAGGAAAGGDAPAPLIPEGLVVFGFAESLNPQQQLLPTFYLGEYRVTASTPNQVTLVPTGPLEPVQEQRINNNQARSWSLYELLPLDGHEPFIAEGSVPSDDNVFGRVDEELVRSLLGNQVSPETLQDYLRDGSRATQDDPPLSRWTKIEFLKNHSLDVDSPEQRGALDGGYFDINGRAVDARLQRGEDGQVQFKTGEQILIKEEFADQLIAENVAKLIGTYYLRPLNDYRFVLRHIRLRLAELANRKQELEFEEKVLTEAIDKSNAMLVANQDIKLKLEQDLAQFRAEKNAIEQYTAERREQVAQMRQELSRLHKSNLELEERLEQIHLTIERQMDALTMAQ